MGKKTINNKKKKIIKAEIMSRNKDFQEKKKGVQMMSKRRVGMWTA